MLIARAFSGTHNVIVAKCFEIVDAIAGGDYEPKKI